MTYNYNILISQKSEHPRVKYNLITNHPISVQNKVKRYQKYPIRHVMNIMQEGNVKKGYRRRES